MSCIFVGLKYLNLNSVIGGEEKAIIDGISRYVRRCCAMITSIIGIFSLLSALKCQEFKTKVEENKNDFLS
jgi:hypothetical protein